MTRRDGFPAWLRNAALVAGVSAAALALLSPVPFRGMLASDGFMPHGHCYLWDPKLVALHVVSDGLIGAAYVAISVTLAVLVYRARDEIPFSWAFLAFGAFIIACGATHFMEVWTLWHPTYWLAGNVKLLTALASVTTAIALPPLVPRVLGAIQAQRIAGERHAEFALARAREQLAQVEQVRRDEAVEIKARLAAIVESSEDAIIGKDLSGIISDWNRGAERMLGYRAEEVIGRPIQLLVPRDRHEEESRILETLRRGGQVEHFETVRVAKSGEHVQVSISVSPVRDATGVVVGAASIARDVTARKALEAEREALLGRERDARSAAEAANHAKDAFLATVSHELRTPLSPILAWVRMLREGGLDGEKTKHALETIERNARAQGQIVDDLLDVSRIVAGKLRLEARPIDLVPILRSAIEVTRPAAEAKAIQLEVALDTETGRVVGDPDRLNQVFWNLLSNAVKFTPRGGRVRVALERATTGARITVSDTGQGIRAEFLPHVFERFQQADTGSTRSHGGLGLGLAIVRHIVELHGGTVAVESAGPGEGARFTVELAGAGGDVLRHAGERPARSSYPALGGLRVLVVDDEPDANDVVRTLLGTCGAEVRIAASAGHALEVLSGWRPDVVVTDIGMPDQDGYALLAGIEAQHSKLGRIPVIALTAYAGGENRVRILAAGFQMHVPKPIEPAELVVAVASVARATGRL
jgi:PAS domain S-box-containing protein